MLEIWLTYWSVLKEIVISIVGDFDQSVDSGMATLDSQVKSTLQVKTDQAGRNATFVIDDEDHTLGNTLRYVISCK